MVEITVTSKTSGRIKKASLTARQLVENFIDEADLVQEITKCNCQAVGETYVVDCNCDYEWEDYVLVYSDES